jgi:MarR family transcriptional regulator, transcriptional regulator for hemolysin
MQWLRSGAHGIHRILALYLHGRRVEGATALLIYLHLDRLLIIMLLMNKQRSNLAASLGRTLLPLARRWRAEGDRVLSALGISHATAWVLVEVGRLGNRVRQSELATALDMRGPSLVELIDRLEKERLLDRQIDENDRRKNYIVLTDAGRALTGSIEDALDHVRQELVAQVNNADLEVTLRVLEQISCQLDETLASSR